MIRFIKSLYFTPRFYLLGITLIFSFIGGFIWNPILAIGKVALVIYLLSTIIDTFLLFRFKKALFGHRVIPDKLSNGDENPIRIILENRYPQTVYLKVIDEIPHQFQRRDIQYELKVEAGKTRYIDYFLRPVKRGEYDFGELNVFIKSGMGLVYRRMKYPENKVVPVYPSYLQVRKYELLAIHNQLTMVGIKKIRKIGHNMEFEQIKEYVPGDDVRTINWKATARKNQLMVNNYQDEKSQQVYCLIDKGRVMEMPFNGMTLLDYAINASLVLANIATLKDDKAGLITFQHKIGSVLPASKRNKQMYLIQEALYNQKTAFRETDFSRLHALVKNKIGQRSLLVIFTNFESRVSLDRELPFLASLAKSHVVVLVFFQNTELNTLLHSKPSNTREIYHKAMGEKFAYEKKLVVKELNAHGIYTVLTSPEDLTINTINKYLEMKARGVI